MTLLQDRPARQSSNPTECRHSDEPFDTAFRVINERRDISPAAKLVHARLVSQHRLGAAWTQAEIGEHLGMSRHQVWRAIGELVAVGLVQTIRYGLGRPNGYVLLGVDQASLDGSGGRASASRPATQTGAGRPDSGSSHTYRKEETRKNQGYRQPPRTATDYTSGPYGHLVRR